MRRRIETHKLGKVTKIIPVPEVREEQAEVEIEGAHPLYGKIRIVNFLRSPEGESVRLSEGDDVDVVIGSDNDEPNKAGDC
jgi:hypothetical protein